MDHRLTPVAQKNKLALIGIRYDENSSFTKGAADAPPQIRAALRSDAWKISGIGGTGGRARTCDLLIRSQTLYPTELRLHAG